MTDESHDEFDETERRLEAAARSADDAVRSWRPTHDLILPAEPAPSRRRALYPALSAAAVTAIAITAVALATTGGGSSPSGGGAGSSQDPNAPQHAADALVALIPGLQDVHTSVVRDGTYLVTAQYAPHGSVLADVRLTVTDQASAYVDCTTSASEVPAAKSSGVLIPADTEGTVLPPDATGSAKIDPGLDGTSTYPGAADGNAGTASAADDPANYTTIESVAPPTAAPPVATSPTDTPPSGATVYSCGYGWATGNAGGGTDPGSADPSVEGESFALGEVRADGTQVEIEIDALAQITSADKIADDKLQAVLDSPDVQPGGVCDGTCTPGPSLSEVPLPGTTETVQVDPASSAVPGTAAAPSATSSYVPPEPPASASDLPLTGPPTTSPSGSPTG